MNRLFPAALLCVCLPPVAAGQDEPASGAEPAAAADLAVEVRSGWVGGRRGGYWPVRIELENRGPARSVTAAFVPFADPADPDRPAVVTKTVAVPAGAAASFTLPVPLTAARGNGEVLFVADPPADAGGAGGAGPARTEAELRAAALDLPNRSDRAVTLPAAGGEGVNRPALLIAAAADPSKAAMAGFEAAAADAVAAVANVASRVPPRRTVSPDGETYAAVDPADWPRTWLGFTTVDLVLVTPETLAGMPAEVRAALTDWLHAGGTVVVSGANPAGEAAWAGPLGLGGLAGDWRALADGPLMTEIAAPRELTPGATLDFIGGWLAAAKSVRARPALGGRVYAVDGRTVGPGTRPTWAVILKDLGPDRLTVSDRLGAFPRGTNREFYEWLVPGVRGVPVAGFLVLMTGFAVLIGPVNYFWLKRRHQVGRLAVTIPLIAAAAGASLLLLSAVMHGWTPKGRRLEVTVHDPAADRAVTFARTALFAPRDPGGLAFDPSAAVLRMPPPGGAGGGGRVDWTDRQSWGGTFLPARTRTQFVTVAPRAERGRLTAEPGDARRGLRVTNGYEHDFTQLLVSDAAGVLYRGTDVPAGAAATLAPLDSDGLFAWRAALDLAMPERPPGLSADGLGALGQVGFLVGRRGGDPGASFRASLAYRTLLELKGLNEREDPLDALAAAPLLPADRGVFAAILGEEEDGTFGGVGASFRGDLRVLVGSLDRPAATADSGSAADPGPADGAAE